MSTGCYDALPESTARGGGHMPPMTSVAESFLAACDTGKGREGRRAHSAPDAPLPAPAQPRAAGGAGGGWGGCRAYCAPDATFSAQAEPLLEVKTLEQYAEWMKAIVGILPDAHYEVKSLATDEARNNVAA